MRQLPLLTPPVLSVADLTRYLRQLFEGDDVLADVWVSGEISNLSRPASGHIYFTLKDAQAALRCVIWKSAALRLRQDLQNGQAIEAHGSIGIYEAGGNYQLYIDTLRPAGEGALYQEFLRLKDQLEAEGLFDLERKRPIPAAPQRIGLVTSPTGAALQDMLNTLRRRYPLAQVILAPCAVQGVEAPPEIVAALQRLAALPQPPDVILAARGGGSLEDLWCFNDERVVRAIAASPIPVVTGIGHETDFTLSDFAADVRAPTPTGAAVLATPDMRDLVAELAGMAGDLNQMMQAMLAEQQVRLTSARHSLQMASPVMRLQREQQTIDTAGQRLQRAMQHGLDMRRMSTETLASRLLALSPLAVLQRGYAIVTRQTDGIILRNASQAHAGDGLSIRLASGRLDATTEKTYPEDQE